MFKEWPDPGDNDLFDCLKILQGMFNMLFHFTSYSKSRNLAYVPSCDIHTRKDIWNCDKVIVSAYVLARKIINVSLHIF
jgi:hypothetical protein